MILHKGFEPELLLVSESQTVRPVLLRTSCYVMLIELICTGPALWCVCVCVCLCVYVCVCVVDKWSCLMQNM